MFRTHFVPRLVLIAPLAASVYAQPAPQSAAGPANLSEIDGAHGGPLFVSSPIPSCSSATTNGGSNATGGPILDQQTTTSTIVISGADPYTWDVDLTTGISHTSNIDLEIRLISPAGSVCTVATACGGMNDDVFNGTTFDDQSANGPCSDYSYTNGVTATSLQPEGSFDMFRGENPNGTWTLEIYDRAVGDQGSLNAWSLTVTSLVGPPASPMPNAVASSDVPKSITDFTTSTSTTTVSGLQSFITDVDLLLDITHNFSDDLEVTLTSPSGTVVTITTDNGGPTNNVFAGTTFDDDVANTVTDYAYVNNVLASPLSPEGSLASLIGEDPNGVWTLTIYDDRANNAGTLNAWTLSITTGGGVPLGAFCTAGTSLQGCTPSMSFIQVNPPSISAGFGFTVECIGMDGVRNGGMYYGLAPLAQPISAGSSFFCTTAPRQRLLQFPFNQTGGVIGTCTGVLSVDLNTFLASHPSALGGPYMACQTLYVQAFNRDPGNLSKSLNFSNGLAVTLHP